MIAVDAALPSMLGPALPEVAVDEHHNALPGDGDARSDKPSIDADREVFAKAVACRWRADRSAISGFLSLRRVAAKLRERPGDVT